MSVKPQKKRKAASRPKVKQVSFVSTSLTDADIQSIQMAAAVTVSTQLLLEMRALINNSVNPVSAMVRFIDAGLSDLGVSND